MGFAGAGETSKYDELDMSVCMVRRGLWETYWHWENERNVVV